MKQEVAICNSVVDLDGVKQKLAKTIARLIAHKKLKQREVEQLLNIKQPRVSDLVNGKVEKFSIDSLLEYLNKIGYVIEGYPADDANYINTIKTRLVTSIGEIIVANKFKQRQVQEILNIKQPRVSDLVNKKIGYVFEVTVMESSKTPVSIQFKTVCKDIKKPRMPKKLIKEHKVA